MKVFSLGVSRALCASPRCGVRAQRTEVFAIVGKNRDRRRRRSLRRRDRYHEVTDEGSSRAAVPLPSPSSPPSAELPPKGKPSSSLASPVQGEVDCRRQDGRVVVPARHQPLQPSRLAPLGTLPCTGRARVESARLPSRPVIPPDARRNACLQEHFDEAAHESRRGEVSGQGRAPLPVIPRSFCDEESPRKGQAATNEGIPHTRLRFGSG